MNILKKTGKMRIALSQQLRHKDSSAEDLGFVHWSDIKSGIGSKYLHQCMSPENVTYNPAVSTTLVPLPLTVFWSSE